MLHVLVVVFLASFDLKFLRAEVEVDRCTTIVASFGAGTLLV
jgi:hypothetical protein